MGNVFGEQKPLKDIIRDQKRAVDRSIRSLERERNSMHREEEKLIAEIKRCAKDGRSMKSVQIMAKDLVRIRKHQEKFIELQAQLRAIKLQMQTMASTAQLSDSMGQITRSMMMMNQQLNIPQLQRIMMEFQRQTGQMEMKQEMVGDAIEDAMDNEEDEEETEAIVGQVLDSIGIDMKGLGEAPKSQVAEASEVKQQEARPQMLAGGGGDAEDAALEARFNRLEKGDDKD